MDMLEPLVGRDKLRGGETSMAKDLRLLAVETVFTPYGYVAVAY